jgi:hypothetical protein
VRPVTEADFSALTRLDLTYPTDRYLHIERSGEVPEMTWTLCWRRRTLAPQAAVYAAPDVEWLTGAYQRAGLFLV